MDRDGETLASRDRIPHAHEKDVVASCILSVDYCQVGREVVSVVGEGLNSIGDMCQDEDVYEIPIAPQCRITSNLTCTEVSTGLNCDQIPPIASSTCDCSPDCATEVRMVYTASGCPQSDAGYSCVQTGTLDPQGSRVVVTSGGSIIFNGDIPLNGEAIITNGGQCVPEEFTVLISNVGSNQVKQTVEVNTGCNQNGVELGTTFGGVDFSGYTCQNGESENCLTDVAFETCAINEGPIPLGITEYTLTLDGAVINVLEGPISLLTGEAYCPPDEVVKISRCEPTIYKACSDVEAEDMAGTTCEHKTPLEFEIEPPLTPAPTPLPTLPPTPPPTSPHQLHNSMQFLPTKHTATPTCYELNPPTYHSTRHASSPRTSSKSMSHQQKSQLLPPLQEQQ